MKALIQALRPQLVEIGMADVLGGDVALAIPLFLERQRAENAIGQAAHLVDAIAQPSPKLRRHEIQHGDAVRRGRGGPATSGNRGNR